MGGEDQFFESIFNLDVAQSSVSQTSGMATPAVKVPVLIEDTEFLMEVDTGAAASILSYSDYERYFKYLALRPVQRTFHAYAGTPLDVGGQILVDVEHNGQRATLPLLVVRAESYAPPLLGRSWLTKIRLDWSTLFSPPISQVSVDQDNDVRVERLKEQYREIFKPELGTVKGVKAKLYLKANAKPVFQRARPVPYALRPDVEEELKRMESDGVLKPIEVSDWATPIVCVLKTDGSVRICGDYKGTVNPAIQTEQFPIPTLEEIRGKCQHEISSQRLTCEVLISNWFWTRSHRSCVRSTPSRVCSDIHVYHLEFHPVQPSGSVSIIEQVLTGLSGTCVIMDDLLVGGTNDDEHLKNFEAVFKQFLKFGLRVKLAKCVFMAPSVIYFGLHFSEKGLQPTDEKVKAIKEAPTPRNVTEPGAHLERATSIQRL